MERLRGQDLAEVLRHERRMGAAEAADMVTQIARGIGVAHEAGIVHRDLKPQNVFLAETDGPDVWKILDFGVSKLADGGATLTRGAVLGTPSYMAPEQARGESVDARADVYAVAAIAYRALTGRPPYAGVDVVTVLLEVVQKMPLRPRAVADLDAALESVLMIGLAKDREDRFATAGELASALARAANGDLDEPLRARAGMLQRKHPWGEEAPRSASA
jgi:serine/threonine protein kinase